MPSKHSGRRCIVAGCSNTAHEGVSVHTFPKNSSVSKAWCRFVKLTRSDWKQPSKHSAICSDHFEDGCFERQSILMKGFGFSSKRRLVPGAIPSIYSSTTTTKRPRPECDSESETERDILNNAFSESLEKKPRGAHAKRELARTLQAHTSKQPQNMCVRDSTGRCTLQSKHKCCFPKSNEEKESDRSIKKTEQPSFSDCMSLNRPIKTEPCDDYNEYEQDQCCGDAQEQYRHFTTNSESLESQKNLVPSKYSSASSGKIENEKCLRKSSKLSKNTSNLDENDPFENSKEKFKLIKIRETTLKLDPSHLAEKPSDLARIANQSQTGECTVETSGSSKIDFQHANSHISGSSALMKENSGMCWGKYKNVHLIFKMTNSEYVKTLDRSSETETKSTNEFETNDELAEEVKTLQTDESVTVEIGVKQSNKEKESERSIKKTEQPSFSDCMYLNRPIKTEPCDDYNEFETNDELAEEVKTLQTDESVTVEIGVKQLPMKAWASASNKPITIAWQKSSEDIGNCPTLNGQTDTAECDKISSSESELPETDKTQTDLRVSGKTIETPEEERLKPSPCETDHVNECSSSNLMGMKRNSICISYSTNLGTSSEATTKKKFISSEIGSGTTEVMVYPQPTQKVTVRIPRDGDCSTNKVRNGKLLKVKNTGGPSGKTLNHKSLRPCPCELHKTEMSAISSESKYSSKSISDIFISKVLSCVSLDKEVNWSFSFLDTDSRKDFNIYVFNNGIRDTINSDISDLDDGNQTESGSSDTKSLIYENNLDDLFLSLMCKRCPCPADPDHVRAEKLSDTMLYVSVSCCCDHLICSWIWHMK